ncbi:MAG: 2,3-bisphosphoglycerate-independent phosphoglycerate mutase [Clostridia bacterium]|nr:2,3-bisphosphoglycerate-independent phosphoglycerate mutase [Clostridia bacterium]
MKKLTALLILDGFGYREEKEDNAILIDGVKNIRKLWESYPHTLIQASDVYVGLDPGQMGNSEVGHMNIGAGRIAVMDGPRISKSIREGDFFENPALVGAIENVKEHGSALHIIGLCSDGGVHSEIKHLYALLKLARMNDVERVYIHCLTDGRDTSIMEGVNYIKEIIAKCGEIGVGEIATIQGRYYGMDRDKRYERIKRAYDAIVDGVGEKAEDAVKAVEESYRNGKTDEFIEPIVMVRDGKPVATVNENDSVIFFNFRTDRPTELTEAFIFEDYEGFERIRGYMKTYFVCMTCYRDDFVDRAHIAFMPAHYEDMLGEYVSRLGKKQIRIAESEKKRHVTFFFNGGTDRKSPGEDWYILDSPKVESYKDAPEMRARDLTQKAVEVIRSHEYDLMIMNFANPDMVGHTAVPEAIIKAVHTVDECVGTIIEEIIKEGGACLLTADHGNCETMVENGQPMTKHTVNPVPLIYIGEDANDVTLRDGGQLSNIAPTLLDMMGLPKPEAMTSSGLIVRRNRE